MARNDHRDRSEWKAGVNIYIIRAPWPTPPRICLELIPKDSRTPKRLFAILGSLDEGSNFAI